VLVGIKQKSSVISGGNKGNKKVKHRNLTQEDNIWALNNEREFFIFFMSRVL